VKANPLGFEDSLSEPNQNNANAKPRTAAVAEATSMTTNKLRRSRCRSMIAIAANPELTSRATRLRYSSHRGEAGPSWPLSDQPVENGRLSFGAAAENIKAGSTQALIAELSP
jgi:hypothetical protein